MAMQRLATSSLNKNNNCFQLFKLITEKLGKKKRQSMEDVTNCIPAATVG